MVISVFEKEIQLRTGGKDSLDNIYYEGLPPQEILYVLSGTSNVFTSLSFSEGAFIDTGSIVIGSRGPGGVLQTYDIGNQQVIDITTSGKLGSDSILDNSV